MLADYGKRVAINAENDYQDSMGKLLNLQSGHFQSLVANGFGALLKDVMRQDDTEGQFLILSRDPALSLTFGTTPLTLTTLNNHHVTSSEIWVLKNQGTPLDTLAEPDTYVKRLLVGRAGSGWTIKRHATDTVLAPAAYGLETRTTFPTLQTFCEKALTITALRTLLGSPSTLWEPWNSPLVTPIIGIVIDQGNQLCSVVFKETPSVGSWLPILRVALDEGDTSHFAE